MDLSKIDIKDLACLISDILKSHGVDAVLVGGACVSIYSQNRYQSYDLDFVTYEELKVIEKILIKHGFKRTGRCFSNEKCPYIIDFVNPPVAIGQESIRSFEIINSSIGSLKLLTATDCVKDRLSSYFNWNDTQALDQALLVARDNQIDAKDINRWAKQEGHEEKMNEFLKRLRK
jgi:hypothetical protein